MHLGCEDEYAKPDNFVLGKLLASVIIKNIYKLWECDKASYHWLKTFNLLIITHTLNKVNVDDFS